MKFTFKPSPNYLNQLSTGRIMMELTLALMFVFIVTLGFYATNASYGVSYVIQACTVMGVAVATSVITEAVWYAATKQNVVKSIKNSYPWVTGIIIALMCMVNTEIYPVIVATIIAVFFGKIVFGGFGQNIFNPAAVGRAVIFASFAGAVIPDFVTGATPATTIASSGWLLSDASSTVLLADFNGLLNLFVGNYPGAMGETSALAIIIAGVYLSLRGIIDWRIPVTYLTSIFVIALIIGFMYGVGVWYPLYHVFAGGAVFAAVFMLTDPVTSPTSAPGRIIFSIGAAAFTVLLRIHSSLPEGVLYSILLMNMFSPMIERITDGSQIKNYKKNIISVVVAFVLFSGVVVLASSSLEVAELSGPKVEVNGNVYTVTAQGYAGENVFDIVIEDGVVSSVENTYFADTAGIGDAATKAEHLATFQGKKAGDSMDIVSGATVTSNSVIDAVNAALAEAQ